MQTKRKPIRVLWCVTLALVAGNVFAAGEIMLTKTKKGDPVAVHERRWIRLRYEKVMQRFEAQDKTDLRTGEIVFTGSSSMVGWRTVSKDMAPLPVINRAFGGSDSGQLWFYADRAILPRDPAIIVAYIGDNDMPQSRVSVENYMKYIGLFVERVRAQRADTRLVFLANKPSVARWKLWPKYLAANEALREYCEQDPLLTYVDITPTLLDENGEVRPDRFKSDMLHFKAEVYVDWTRLIKPVVQVLWDEVRAPAASEE